jgi:hypothetical protein
MTLKPGQSVRLLKDAFFSTVTGVGNTLASGNVVRVLRVLDRSGDRVVVEHRRPDQTVFSVDQKESAFTATVLVSDVEAVP